MKLTSILSPLGAPGMGAPGTNSESAGLGRMAPVRRSRPALQAMMMERLPDPPPLDRVKDVVDISQEASFVLAASQYDPHHMAPNELYEMAGMLRQAGAIGAADYALLLRGPQGDGYRLADPEAPRDMIADWQMRLASHMDRPNLGAIGADTRALNVLGRVAAAREQF
jgi:hypothetical protein